ncbi:carboxypeptidase-like regulatory domain-containing protein [Luedemannella helvata]
MPARPTRLLIATALTVLAATGLAVLPAAAAPAAHRAAAATPPATISPPATLPAATTPGATGSQATTGPATSPPLAATQPGTPTATRGPDLTRPPATSGSGGVISGQVLDGDTPVAGATVALVLSIGAIGQTTTTDAAGRFRLANLRPGSYKLRFDLPYGFLQYYPAQATSDLATVLTVVGGEEQTIVERARPHGSLGGRITTAAGAPVANAYVQLSAATGSPIGSVFADADGNYLFPFVKAGDVILAASPARYGAPIQYAPDKPNGATAGVYSVAVGTRTTLDESLLPLGRVTGSYTMDGRKLANVLVEAVSTTGGSKIINRSEGDGTFRLWLRPGTYQLHFDPADGEIDQWWRGKESQADADVITVTEDATFVADETALPATRAAGYVHTPDGSDHGFLSVVMTDQATGRSYQTSLYASGRWAMDVRPGTYLVRYETSYQTQWAYGKTSAAEADRIVVPAGTETLIEDTLLPLSTVNVTAVDAVSGERAQSFCATLDGSSRYEITCTDDGTVVFRTGEGTYKITVDDRVHLLSSVPDVRVARGATVDVAVPLKPAGILDITVVDARTGEAVNGVCLHTVPAARPPYFVEGNSGCTEADGRLTLPRILPDRYHLFAGAYDGVHGSQWLGDHGGVGSQAAARVLTIRGGATTRVTVRLDRAGTITGVVTDRATGRPVADATVMAGGKGTGTDADGRYTIDGLGPYSWPLLFTHPDYAGVWSGGGTDRLKATGVRVRTGQTTRYDATLRTGVLITGAITVPGGGVPDWAQVSAVDADTFDVLAYVPLDSDGRYRLHVTGPNKVKLLFEGSAAGSWVQRWYPGVADFTRGRTIPVPPAGTLTADFVLAP